jgi:hypothetical protein
MVNFFPSMAVILTRPGMPPLPRWHPQRRVARLLTDGHLLIDDFYNGKSWRVGLRRYQVDGTVPPLTLQILPLRRDAPIFLEPAVRAALPHTSQVDQLKTIGVVPQYQLQLEAR